jgi:hypothetical protein
MFDDELYGGYSFDQNRKYLVDGDMMNQLLIVIMGLIEERPEVNKKFLTPLMKSMGDCVEVTEFNFKNGEDEFDIGMSLDEILYREGLTLHDKHGE